MNQKPTLAAEYAPSNNPKQPTNAKPLQSALPHLLNNTEQHTPLLATSKHKQTLL